MIASRSWRPNYVRFLIAGGTVGLVVGVLVAVFSRPAPQYSASTSVGYFGVIGVGLGALLGGVVAILLDRRGD